MKNVYEPVIGPLIDPDLTATIPQTLTASLCAQYPENGQVAGWQIQFYYDIKYLLHHTFDSNEWDIFQEVLPIALETRRWI